MVRTKADSTAVRVSGAKASRKAVQSAPTRISSDSSDSKGGKNYSGGNSYHPRETPGWQKPITTFFGSPASKEKGSEEACSSKEVISTSNASGPSESES